jgi:hypothetical protein
LFVVVVVRFSFGIEMQNSLDESKLTHNKRIKDCIILEETEYDVSSASDLNRDKTFTNLISSNKKNVHFDSLNQIKHETPPSLTSITTTTTTSFTHPSCSMTSNCVLNSINSNINNNTNKNNNNNKNFLICLKFPESNRRKLKNNKNTRFKVKYIFFVF